MTKPNSPYDYDTNDMAAEIASKIEDGNRERGGLQWNELIAVIEKQLDSMIVEGKFKTFAKRHHILT